MRHTRSRHDHVRGLGGGLGRGFDAEQTDELLAAFFERVYRKAPDFDWRSPFTVWLRTILLNLARDEMRRWQLARARLLPDDAAERGDDPRPSGERDPEQAVLDAELGRLVARALAELSPLDRHIVRHCIVDGGAPRDLARELGMTANAVSQRLSRAKRRLRRILSRDDEASR